MLILPDGSVGAGKGLSAVYIIKHALEGRYDYLLHIKHDHVPRKIFANYQMTFQADINKPGGNFNPLEFVSMVNKELIQDHAIISIHEAHRWLDSWNTMRLRASDRERRMDFDYLVDESRKRDWIMILDTQNVAKLDNRIRDRCNYKINCMNFAPNPAKDFPLILYEVIKDPEAEHFLPEEYWHWLYQPPSKKWYRDLFAFYSTKEKGGYYATEASQMNR